VVVQGRLRQRSFEDREGQKRTVVEMEVDEVGPSLRYATAKVNKVSSGGNSGFSGGGQGGSSGGGQQQSSGSDPWGSGPSGSDPWGSAPPAGAGPSQDDEPPF
jgi:single-strand DNA-binding protein